MVMRRKKKCVGKTKIFSSKGLKVWRVAGAEKTLSKSMHHSRCKEVDSCRVGSQTLDKVILRIKLVCPTLEFKGIQSDASDL